MQIEVAYKIRLIGTLQNYNNNLINYKRITEF